MICVKIDLRERDDCESIVGDSHFWIALNANIENVVTGDCDDIIFCNNLNNTINPGKGNNVIHSNQGYNKFIFDGGYDTIKNFKLTDKIIISNKDITCNLLNYNIFNNKLVIKFENHLGNVSLDIKDCLNIDICLNNIEFI